ncbi:unnamed protein product (mitochondrion) [Plasmodiophora brassicae]|uniref:Uncharacterized protein n=1 Tax=Plasmodiophora brassicae TaxID=37360 RepID=A0A3P3YN20_PLABS|nr:unnamed protein product [Plasmodiophora brassicae]
MYSASLPARAPVASAADVEAAGADSHARKRLRRANQAAPAVTDAEVIAASIRTHAVVGEHAAQAYLGAGEPAWFAPAIANALLPIMNALQHGDESRSISRLINSQLSQDVFPIDPLVNNTGAVPAGFPATTAALKAMPGPDVDGLLAAYGLVPHGNVVDRRRQLGRFLGLYHRSMHAPDRRPTDTLERDPDSYTIGCTARHRLPMTSLHPRLANVVADVISWQMIGEGHEPADVVWRQAITAEQDIHGSDQRADPLSQAANSLQDDVKRTRHPSAPIRRRHRREQGDVGQGSVDLTHDTLIGTWRQATILADLDSGRPSSWRKRKRRRQCKGRRRRRRLIRTAEESQDRSRMTDVVVDGLGNDALEVLLDVDTRCDVDIDGSFVDNLMPTPTGELDALTFVDILAGALALHDPLLEQEHLVQPSREPVDQEVARAHLGARQSKPTTTAIVGFDGHNAAESRRPETPLYPVGIIRTSARLRQYNGVS